MNHVGVVAMQGAYQRHVDILHDLGVPATLVRTPEDLGPVDALVLPGGESTTISKLLRRSDLWDPLAARLSQGTPAFGTCAGAILLASCILDPVRNDAEPFGAVDVAVRRNAFGRQVDSFEADIDVAGVAGGPFHAVFIRAPWFELCGVGVEVLAWQNEHAVVVRQGPVLLSAFHPELTDDSRIHEKFLETVA